MSEHGGREDSNTLFKGLLITRINVLEATVTVPSYVIVCPENRYRLFRALEVLEYLAAAPPTARYRATEGLDGPADNHRLHRRSRTLSSPPSRPLGCLLERGG